MFYTCPTGMHSCIFFFSRLGFRLAWSMWFQDMALRLEQHCQNTWKLIKWLSPDPLRYSCCLLHLEASQKSIEDASNFAFLLKGWTPNHAGSWEIKSEKGVSRAGWKVSFYNICRCWWWVNMMVVLRHIVFVKLTLINRRRFYLYVNGISCYLVDEAVEYAYNAIMANHGQNCCAGSRTFVQEEIYDEFVAKASVRASKRKVGNPWEEGVEHGPQVHLSEKENRKLSESRMPFLHSW